MKWYETFGLMATIAIAMIAGGPKHQSPTSHKLGELLHCSFMYLSAKVIAFLRQGEVSHVAILPMT